MLSWTDADARATLRGIESVDQEAAWAIELVPMRDGVGYEFNQRLDAELFTPAALERGAP